MRHTFSQLQRKRQDEQRATATDEGIRAEKSREGAANVSRRLEQHILNNKVNVRLVHVSQPSLINLRDGSCRRIVASWRRSMQVLVGNNMVKIDSNKRCAN